MESETDISEDLNSGSLHGGMISFPLMILFQINRVAQLGSKPIGFDESSEDAWRNAIITLDCMMDFYDDDEFDKRKKQIKKMSDPYDKITTKEEFFELFSALIKKVNNCPGITPYEQGTSQDED